MCVCVCVCVCVCTHILVCIFMVVCVHFLHTEVFSVELVDDSLYNWHVKMYRYVRIHIHMYYAAYNIH